MAAVVAMTAADTVAAAAIITAASRPDVPRCDVWLTHCPCWLTSDGKICERGDVIVVRRKVGTSLKCRLAILTSIDVLAGLFANSIGLTDRQTDRQTNRRTDYR